MHRIRHIWLGLVGVGEVGAEHQFNLVRCHCTSRPSESQWESSDSWSLNGRDRCEWDCCVISWPSEWCCFDWTCESAASNGECFWAEDWGGKKRPVKTSYHSLTSSQYFWENIMIVIHRRSGRTRRNHSHSGNREKVNSFTSRLHPESYSRNLPRRIHVFMSSHIDSETTKVRKHNSPSPHPSWRRRQDSTSRIKRSNSEMLRDESNWQTNPESGWGWTLALCWSFWRCGAAYCAIFENDFINFNPN